MNPVWQFLNGVPVIPVARIGTSLAGDGSASAPSYSFASDTDTGWYRIGANSVGLGISGAAYLRLDGSVTVASDTVFGWSPGNATLAPDVSLSRGAADVLMLASGDKFAFGGLTSSQPLLKASGNTVEVRLADDSAYAGITANTFLVPSSGAFQLAASLAIRTAPTISSGFGTSPSVVSSNGTAAFTINVGTGGTASAGVIGMPAATTGWIAYVFNITQTAANRANVQTIQTASTTTSITVQNQTISTGAAVAWTASDVLRIIAFAY